MPRCAGPSTATPTRSCADPEGSGNRTQNGGGPHRGKPATLLGQVRQAWDYPFPPPSPALPPPPTPPRPPPPPLGHFRQAWDYPFPPPSPALLPPHMPRRLDPEAAIGHLDRLYAAARALSGDPHLAEDLVQDTYAADLSRPRFLSGSDELGYLLRALRNRWRDELRTRARRPQPLSLDDGGGEPLRRTTPAPHE